MVDVDRESPLYSPAIYGSVSSDILAERWSRKWLLQGHIQLKMPGTRSQEPGA